MKTKGLGIVSVFVASVVFGYLFVLSWVIGHVAGNLGGGKREGIPGRVKSIIIPLGQWRIHLHHWLCSLGLIGFSSASGYHFLNPQITYGLLGGLAFQGIYCYSDWYRIVVTKSSLRARRLR